MDTVSPTPALEVRGAAKMYEGFALRDISFSLPRGYIMGLIGPNGAGKTTLLRLILNLAHLDSGEIRIFGLDHAREEVAVRSRIGFVHEHPAFHRDLSVTQAASVLAPFYASWEEDTFRRLAAEFDLPRDKPLKHLSRGMRTRFALAVALAHRAELLLLDEPSSGLDPVFRRELLERLSELIEGGETSILFSTHITSDLDRLADYITFIRRGELVFSAGREEILEHWALVKGGLEILTPQVRALFEGVVTSEYGFTGLTADVERARLVLRGAEVVLERASLEDVVFYTGRTGAQGFRLRADPR